MLMTQVSSVILELRKKCATSVQIQSQPFWCKLFCIFCDGQDALTIPLGVVVAGIHEQLIKYLGTTVLDVNEHRNYFLP